MKIKTSELTGAALDWAVSSALGLGYRYDDKYGPMCFRPSTTPRVVAWDSRPLPYSTSWQEGGPIIEIERIKLEFDGAEGFQWWGYHPKIDDLEHGPTPLVAAMRCFVLSRFGDEVDVPEEFKE